MKVCKTFFAYLLIFSLMICSCSCRKNKTSIELDYRSHPSVSYSDTCVAEYISDLSADESELKEVFGDLQYEEGYCWDEGSFFHWYYIRDKLFLNVFKNGQRIDRLICDIKKTDYVSCVKKNGDGRYLVYSDDCLSTIVDGKCFQNVFVGTEVMHIGSDKDTMYVCGSRSVSIYDSDLNLSGYYETSEDILCVDHYDGKLYLITNKDDGDLLISSVSLKDPDKTRDISDFIISEDIYTGLSLGFNSRSAALHMIDGDHLILVTDKAVFRIDINKGYSELLVNTCDYGVSVSWLDGFISLEENKITLLCNVETECFEFDLRVVSFEFGDPINQKQEIVAGMFSDCSAQFYEYNRRHDDHYISLVYPESIESDIIRTVELINNGEGVDLWVLNNSYFRQMRDAGILYDTSYIDIDTSDLYVNILNSAMEDGHRYGIVYDYYLAFAVFVSDFNKIDFISAAQYHDLKELFPDDEIEEILYDFYGVIDNEIKTKGRVSSETVRMYLELCDRFGNDGYDCNDQIKDSLIKGDMLFYPAYISSYEQFYALCQEFDERFTYGPMPGLSSTAIMCNSYLAISSDSKNIEDCKEIIEFCLSYECQKDRDMPLNKTAMKEVTYDFRYCYDLESFTSMLGSRPSRDNQRGLIYDEISSFIESLNTDEDKEKMIAMQEYSILGFSYEDRDFDYSEKRFDQVLSSVDGIFYHDTEIMAIISEETDGFIQDKKDIDTTADIICDRINTYISE